MIRQGSGDEELTRLEAAVGELVDGDLPAKLPQPSPGFRLFGAASATSNANQNYMKNVKAVLKAYRSMIALTEKAIFRLPLEGESEGEEASSRSRRQEQKQFRFQRP